MKALTVHQPWAWAIITGGKNIENRAWPTSFRGRVLIHAGKGGTAKELGDAVEFMHRIGVEAPDVGLEDYPRGVILGAVTIVDCVEESSSPWFVGPYGFVLENPKYAPALVPCRGQERFWEVPGHVADALRKGRAE